MKRLNHPRCTMASMHSFASLKTLCVDTHQPSAIKSTETDELIKVFQRRAQILIDKMLAVVNCLIDLLS